MSKNPTNVEFVTRLMSVSPAGDVSQLVVLQAIDTYARQVANIPLEAWLTQCKKPIEQNRVWGLIAPRAWHTACSEIVRAIDARIAAGAGGQPDGQAKA